MKRGWSTENNTNIPGGSTLENLIMFSGTQWRTMWRQDVKENHILHFISPGGDIFLATAKKTRTATHLINHIILLSHLFLFVYLFIHPNIHLFIYHFYLNIHLLIAFCVYANACVLKWFFHIKILKWCLKLLSMHCLCAWTLLPPL